jgi:glycine cleavage system H protein
VSSSRLYTKTHEWIAFDEGRSEGAVGITDFAQKEVTDVVFVELPKIGKKAPRGGEIAIIESVKAAFSIYAPAGGEVVSVNNALDGDPGLLNRDPYGNGWICRMRVENLSELKDLMDEKAYEAFLADGGGLPGHG